VDRDRGLVRARDADGAWSEVSHGLRSYDTVLGELGDPARTPEVIRVRDQMRAWRFYDQLRTDSAAPARRPAVGTTTPVLSGDGSDLASALATIEFLGESPIHEAVERAFPGASLVIDDRYGWVEVGLHQRALGRPLRARELSDGTLRYLLCVAVLLTPRPPELLVLNEPETSLHPDLLGALSKTRSAGESPQMIELVKQYDETHLQGQGRLDEPPWTWPSR
jgi:predicted ATPase